MFDHYIITRFNLRNPIWEAENNGGLITDIWMEQRFELFETYCLPSLLEQSNKNFTWLLYFDTSTSNKFKDRIHRLTEKHLNIKVVFIDGMPLFKDNLKELIAINSKNKKYLITTRIDNDDCIHVDFVKTIQEQFNNQKYQVIDLLKGYSLQINPDIILGKKDHIFNPFISLIEENKNPKTVWSNSHNVWKTEKNVTFVTSKRLWLVVIHENNKTNNFNGYGKVDWKLIKNQFKISNKQSNAIEINAIPEKKWFKLSLKNRVIVTYKVYIKLFKRAIGLYKLKSKV